MKVTFIASSRNQHLSKIIRPENSQAYPFVKNLDSFQYDITVNLDGLREKTRLMQEHAARGHAMLKGNLTKRLQNESRAGKTDTQAPTQNLIFDIDNLVLDGFTVPSPMTKHALGICAEKFINLLPTTFHNVSYILQASASMGCKRGLNLHIEFFLTESYSPRYLKELITHLNFTVPELTNKLTLSAAGTALKMVLDQSVADNTKIIYIAPPTFEGITDPFDSPQSRIQLVKKENHLLCLTSLNQTISPEINKTHKTRKVAQLRTEAGLPRKTEHLSAISVNGQSLNVVTNPDSISLRFVRRDGDYIRFNLDRPGQEPGDSVAYYVKKSAPTIVFNFKNEPPFYLPEACPEVYEWMLNTYADLGQSTQQGQPFAFQDIRTDTTMKGFFNPLTNQIYRIDPATRSNLPDFFADFGFYMPDPLPQYDYLYRPNERPGLDKRNKLVNAYIPSNYFKENPTVLPPDMPESMDELHGTLKKYCPLITAITHHALGSDEEAFNRFVNWLGYIAQKREKTRVAWIIHGTQGTGKGILFNDILSPLFGEDNCATKDQDNIEEMFNSWASQKLMVMIDDFSINDCRSPKLADAKLKRLVTEVRTTERRMHTDQMDAMSFVNVIISSNKFTIVSIPPDDRRYNVAPRQEIKLLTKYPDILTEKEDLPKELPFFAKFLSAININLGAVTTCWDNHAKHKLQNASQNTIEEFVLNFQAGNLEYFLPLLEEHAFTAAEMEMKMALDALLKNCLRLPLGVVAGFRAIDMALLYNYMHRTVLTPTKFSKLAQHYNLHLTQITTHLIGKNVRKQARVYPIKFSIDQVTLQAYRQTYLTENTPGITLMPNAREDSTT